MKTTPFWKIDKRGKVEIDARQLIVVLQNFGLRTYYPTPEMTSEPLFLNIEGNIIEPISPYWIHKMVINAIEMVPIDIDTDILQIEIKNKIISVLIESKILTKKEVLVILPGLNKPIISDTKDSAYFFFRNTAVQVTKDGIRLIPLESLDNYIWKSQIIDKEFILKEYEEVKEKSEYYQFLRNITSLKSKDKWEVNKDRLDNLMTLQGYLLHGYNDRTNARAVALMDSSEIGDPSGRTGKGLFVNGLSKLKKTILEDGKSFKDDNRFRFSQVTPDTKILFINDVKENFNFENIFPTITDGINIEVKFENKKSIPFEDSPKIVISTNYAILGRGSSFEDRIYEFELSNFYSIDHRPIYDFKHRLFDEWDSDQWNLFYSLMLHSLKEYLNKGVVSSEGINRKRNKLIVETSKEFLEWISNLGIIPNHKYEKKELYKDFCSFVGVSALRNEISQLIFTKHLKTWARFNNFITIEGHSNIERTIEFKTK
jgi:hypothetical protein